MSLALAAAPSEPASAALVAEAGAERSGALARSPQPAASAALCLQLHGNVLFPEEVYRALLNLPEGAVANVENAALVQQQLTEFLLRAGYGLAVVEVRPVGGCLDAGIEEGRVEKVVFRGKLNLKTLRFKLALSIPFDIYNRRQLEREGASLAASLGLGPVRFVLVPTRSVEHLGPQLEALPTIQGHSLIGPKRPYELQVFFDRDPWRSGLGLDLRLGSYDGLEAGLNYQREGLLFRQDRLRLAGSGGARLAAHLGDGRRYPAFSRGLAELRWFLPPLVKRRIRPFLWLRADAKQRQRKDLDLERYSNLDLEASLDLRFELGERRGARALPGRPAKAGKADMPGAHPTLEATRDRQRSDATLDLGGGLRRRESFSLRSGPAAPDPNPFAVSDLRVDPFVFLKFNLLLERAGDRFDRRHALSLGLRRFFTLHRDSYALLDYRWQKVFALGWHDLWLRSRGVWMRGSVPFLDERPLGSEFLRGVFQETFAQRAVSVGSNLRFSITRDLYKLGVFADAAVWGELRRPQGTPLLGYGVSVGPSFHALIIDMLQLDLYVAFGLGSDHRFETGSAVTLKKVF